MASAESLLHDIVPLRGGACPDIRIFFATNRIWDEQKKTFGDLYSLKAFAYGECTIRGIEVTSICRYSEDEAVSNISKAKKCFVFVHGFNNTFRSSALRLAGFAQQICSMAGSNDKEIAFLLISWPSRGKTSCYHEDNKLSKESSSMIGELLNQAALRKPDRLNIIAHSLGVNLLWRALKNFPKPIEKNRFGNVFWIAGDVCRRKFCDKFDRKRMIHVRFKSSTSYYCHHDGALAWSRANALFAKRLGQASSHLKRSHLNDTMHCSVKIPSGIALEGDPMYGHTYFTSFPIVRDIFQKVFNNAAPISRGLQQVKSYGWVLKCPKVCEEGIVPLYKLINIKTKTPLLVVTQKNLRIVTKNHLYRYAGVACRVSRHANASFDLPIYDCKNTKDDVHIYTTCDAERSQLLEMGQEDGGILGYLSRGPTVDGIPHLAAILRITYRCGGAVHKLLDTTQESMTMSMMSDGYDTISKTIVGYAVPPY